MSKNHACRLWVSLLDGILPLKLERRAVDPTEMRRISILFPLLLLACEQSEFPLNGAWISDRGRTLAEFRETREFSDEQWSVLSDPTLFGQMVQVFVGGRAFVVFDGSCGAIADIRILSRSGPKIEAELETRDGVSKATFYFEGDRLKIPVRVFGGDVQETFSRISLAAAIQRHTCVAELLAAISSDAV